MSYSCEWISWEDFFEKRVKHHSDSLDAWDTTILKSVHTRSTRLRMKGINHPLDIDLVKSDVIDEIGFITEEELAKRLEKLENLALIVRMIRLN